MTAQPNQCQSAPEPIVRKAPRSVVRNVGGQFASRGRVAVTDKPARSKAKPQVSRKV